MMAGLRRGLVGLAVAGRRLVSGFCVAQDWVPGRPSPQPSPTGRGSKSRPAVEAGRRLVSGFCVAQDWVRGRPSPQPSPTGRGSKSGRALADERRYAKVSAGRGSKRLPLSRTRGCYAKVSTGRGGTSRPTVVALGAVAGLLLVSAALLGQYTPLQAQEEESSEAEGAPRNVAGVRISGLSGSLTYGGRDSFTVEAFNLTTVLAYEVIVSRNSSSLGIGACGTAAQSRSVTGVDSQRLTFTVHGCAAGRGTVTAVVRRSGLTTNEGAASQTVTVTATAPAAPARPTAPNPKAREFTAQWQAPGDTGGTALTGYHVIMRPNGAAWPPDSQAKKVGATTRSQRFTGLAPNRIYWFKVKACNGANQTRCSGWSSQASVTLPIDSPGTPRWGSFSAEATQIRVTWSAPSDTGGVGLTGYGLRHWRVGASEPSSAQTVVNAQTTSRTFSGLASATAYRFSIQACNGPSRCSGWTHKDGTTKQTPTPTPTAAPTEPGRVGRPDVSPRDAALLVDWDAPGDGGSAITHYDVGRRAGTTGAWTETEVRGRTSTTISGLTNGTAYQVRVRAVNHRGDGEWSKTATGTPQVDAAAPENPGPGEPTLAPPACDPIPNPGSTAPTSLGQPNNLHVTPFRNRRAVLRWNPVPGAKKYVVQIRQRTATGWGNWLPPDRRAGKAASGDITTHNCYTVNLDRVITQTSGASEGLAHSVAYGLRLRAVNGGVTSAYSTEAIIIDSPIIEANGKSSAGAPQVKLKWLPIGNILGSDYSSGTYGFHHRRVGGNHRELNWTLLTFDPVKVFSQSSTNPDTIDEDLTMEEVYAIQLRYEETGPQRTSTVFAARDAYAWPSARAADGGERVATFPMNFRVKNRIYAYRICHDGFPGDRTQWENLINHALGQWQLATNGLVRMAHESSDCADYDAVYNDIKTNYGSQFGQPLSPAELAHLQRYLRSLDILTRAQVDDKEANEIIMIDNATGGIYDGLEDMGLFSELSKDFGLYYELGLEECAFGPSACASRAHYHDDKGWVTDIFLPQSTYGKGPFDIPGGLDPGGGVTVDRDDVRFNTCDAPDIGVYQTLVHEAGHVLGIRDGRVTTGWDEKILSGHPSIYESVMSYEDPYVLKPGDDDSVLPNDPDCSPHPLDVLAVYALYQQESGG